MKERIFIQKAKEHVNLEEFIRKQFSQAKCGSIEVQHTPVVTRIIVHTITPGLVIGTGGEQMDMGERDSVIEVPAGGKHVDLADHVRSELLVVIPLKPLCGDKCRGLCPVCGTNLNVGSCSCDSDSHDSRWDALKKVK